MFECNDGTKIEASKHCDGIIDCNDNSDENICLEIPPTDLVEKFMCQDGAKIHVDKGGLFSEIINNGFRFKDLLIEKVTKHSIFFTTAFW